MDLEKQRALNERLETDLLHINDSRGEGSAATDGALDGLGLGMIQAGNKSIVRFPDDRKMSSTLTLLAGPLCERCPYPV